MADTDTPPAPAPAPAAPAGADPEEPGAGAEEAEEVAAPLAPACMDLTEYKPKVDHFENIHTLAEEGKIEGAPNFRQVKSLHHKIYAGLTAASKQEESLENVVFVQTTK